MQSNPARYLSSYGGCANILAKLGCNYTQFCIYDTTPNDILRSLEDDYSGRSVIVFYWAYAHFSSKKNPQKSRKKGETIATVTVA